VSIGALLLGLEVNSLQEIFREKKCISDFNFLNHKENKNICVVVIWNFSNEHSFPQLLLEYGAYVYWDCKRSNINGNLSVNPKEQTEFTKHTQNTYNQIIFPN
jgi:hypothetical protein